MLHLIERIARVGTWIGGLALIGVSFLVLAEVVLRKGFHIGLSAATEMSSYVLAISGAWAFSYALLQRAHVRVDALVRLAPRRLRAAIDVLAQVVLTWFAAMLMWHGYSVFDLSLDMNARSMTPLQVPLWIPQGLWLAGLALFLVSCLVVLARAARLFAAGDLAGVNAAVGTFTSEEEAAAEIAEARMRYTTGGEPR